MNASRKYLSFASVLCLTLGIAVGQNPGVKRTVVQRADISAPGREAQVAHVEFPPGASVGRHTHPGEECSYVIAGEGELMIAGQPVRKIKAGDGFIVPANTIHDAKNTGTGTLEIAAVYVVEKGKPLATPAP